MKLAHYNPEYFDATAFTHNSKNDLPYGELSAPKYEEWCKV